jgi:hypothetical protein
VSAPAQQRPWLLSSVSHPLSLYRPVLALTLVRRGSAGQFEILTGVRTPAANRTHQDVVSVPTLRVADPVAAEWLDTLSRRPDEPLAETDEVAREVANLLARKLGVADWLELGEIELRCRKLGAWQGTSVVGENDDGGLVTENLTMFNACVEVVRGGELFPPSTASYDPLLWARVDDFLRMVVTREVGLLRADLDELLFCAYGLCLQTTARLIAEGGLD